MGATSGTVSHVCFRLLALETAAKLGDLELQACMRMRRTEFGIVVVPLPWTVFWKLWDDVFEVSNSVIHSFGGGLILNIVGNVDLAQLRLSKSILTMVSLSR